MQKQTNIKFKRRLRLAGLASFALALLMPAAGYAWGPERTTYTMEKPSDHVTFNSITNNNMLGDERNFVRVGEANSTDPYTNEIKIVPGKTYEVYIYYHNNAASNLNASGVGIANGVRISSVFPSTVSASKKGKVSAIISATDATPKEVWDEAYFTTDSETDIVLRYVDMSAKIFNRGSTNGSNLSTALFSEEGHFIGVNVLDGRLPGCSEYSGYIIYQVRAEQVGAKVSKSASLDGENFFKVVNPKPGDTVTYRIEFENTGTADMTNVTFHDKLPKGVTLIPGTTMLINNANPDGILMKDIIGENGFNTGMYLPGGKAVITYKVKVNEDAVKDGVCGTNSFVNTIFVDHDSGELKDTSTVQVERTCTENEDPGTPPELPTTGPGEIALAVVAGVCVMVGIYYWYRSQKELNALQKTAAGKDVKDKDSKK